MSASSSQDQFEIREEKPDHHYRTEIPNIIFDLLKGDSLIVYINLKKIAGDYGQCWMSVENFASCCNLSERHVGNIIKKLSEPLIDFPNLPALIKVTHRKKPDGADDTNLINITDIWRLNGNYFRTKKKNKGEGAGHAGGGVHTVRGEGAYRAPKEDPSQEDLKEEEEKSPMSKDDGTPPSNSHINKFKEESLQLSKYLFEKLKVHFPALKEPNIKSWSEDIDKLIRIDKKGVCEVHEMIDWAMNDGFWVKNIHSGNALRRNFEKMYMQMTPVNNNGTFIQKNRASAQEAKSVCKRDEKKFNDIAVLHDGVLKKSTGEKLSFTLHPTEFDTQLAHIFALRRAY